MGKTGNNLTQNDINYHNQSNSNQSMHPEAENTTNKEGNENDFRYPYRHTRKRRNDHGDDEVTSQAPFTPKRRNTEQIDNSSSSPHGCQGETTTASSYFNNNRVFRKQTNEVPNQHHTHESSNRKQQQQRAHESFPPFRIKLKDGNYPVQDVTIIKDLNKKCKLNLTYGRMSTSNNDKHYLLYCNTATQFETLLDKSNWPETICNCMYSIDMPRRFPSSYSVVVLNIPTQWNVQDFCEELKLRYKTIIKCERMFVKGGRPIPRIRIDFSSNKELTEIIQNKRILLDDDNTAYTIEPYVSPTRILRCYNCQQYDDHIAARCPNKDKPICFKCGQQHNFNPDCQNAICCAHCKGNHMAGNPNCPQKIATRENKKIQMTTIGQIRTTQTPNSNVWAGDAAHHLFGNASTTKSLILNKVQNNINADLMKKLDSIENNIQTILKQQADLSQLFNDTNTKINNQAMDILNINCILNDIVCPLLKDVTNIIYTQINTQQKQQINPIYNRLVSFLEQKDSSYAGLHIQHNTKTLQQQRTTTPNPQMTVTSNDIRMTTYDESTC
ncbi:unnamed protein product [Rotaria sp. Silwood2]|nr:unnamed protein product [Rotaria sp. Silwood2]CAF3033466.1 unnamed protein product [Rotaria sp. Silwood2]CAF3318894.1 unnamed protein product [Rotaria sp. Silwood2]CAF3369048.1 unnamed protein product [Rotaria sp. Silwood2]CAF4093875.1 unnamed protein product [Rotaria sp. Silwood2]